MDRKISPTRRTVLVGGAALLAVGGSRAFAQTAPSIPKVDVRFAHFPYFDHTQSIIGLKKGWFDQVGITFVPDDVGIVVQASEASAVFASGRVDVMSASAQLFLPAAKTLPPFKVFFYADIFQGYAIMAQPDSGAKSFLEFRAEGMAAEQAFLATVGQMRGKRFAFPTEAAIKGFIDQALARGKISLADVETVGAPDDAANVALMQAGRADFQVGGVPSRLTLETAGFKPILSSGDLAAYASASAESTELRAVFHDGWVATDEWINANYDTVLRLASVGFRINQFINASPDEAAAIHTPFLNSVAGTTFEPAVAKIAYSNLHPFWNFDQQAGWISDRANPLNAEYVIGSAIKTYEEQGLFQSGEFNWNNFTIVPKVYADLLAHRAKADEFFAKLSGATLTPEAQALRDQARAFYDAFNFLDAHRFAAAAAGG
jgi:ABC-type nitrate/sulfonate/bicarbonate transport system substrate-binding protein